ncbi:hypothetical protein [Thermococcus barophilus]|uniref:Uncharacterized protein n=1 Tax=Thermococcus barophilus TaxID=55802 RepID=A0A0S1XDB3_THEBA|nr:hypothetical protein [Thermococcus barophilus]ALM75731.1 hypothetical protein TBCH5v1_1821 [Thermococcus barophilus]
MVSKDQEEAKKLLKEAYEFGYFIGYKGHSEWIKWVADKKYSIYSKAKELGIYDAVKEAYNQGKIDGRQKRLEELNLGLAEMGKTGITNKKPVILHPKDYLKGAEKDLEREFQSFLLSVKLIELPKLLETMKILQLPKIINTFNEREHEV